MEQVQGRCGSENKQLYAQPAIITYIRSSPQTTIIYQIFRRKNGDVIVTYG